MIELGPVRPALPGGSRTILFDKDGTLVENVPHNVDPAAIRLAAGVGPALRRLADAGYDAAVVTNQPGVALGYFALAQLNVTRDRLAQLLGAQGIALRAFYACPHHPRGRIASFAIVCDCRKPGPGLVRRAIRDLGLIAGDTWMVGDSWADVAAGRVAGCQTALIGPEWRLGALLPAPRRPRIVAPDFASGIDALLGCEAWRPTASRPAGQAAAARL